MKEPHEYATWICNGKKEWGGVPELKVLSIYYQKIFIVVDIQELKLHKFGDENESDGKVYLMYDGTHYNCGALTSPVTNNSRYIFFMNEDYDAGFLEYAKMLKENSEFVDTVTFTLKCNNCGTAVKGQVEA